MAHKASSSPPCLFHLPSPSYCDEAQGRRYFTFSITVVSKLQNCLWFRTYGAICMFPTTPKTSTACFCLILTTKMLLCTPPCRYIWGYNYENVMQCPFQSSFRCVRQNELKDTRTTRVNSKMAMIHTFDTQSLQATSNGKSSRWLSSGLLSRVVWCNNPEDS
jgi:hypothetical protein